MSLTIRNVTFMTLDPGRLADFWAAALGWTERRDGEEEVLLASPGWPFPRLSFQHGARGTTDDDPVHLDLTAEDMEAEVARLEELGAIRLWTIRAELSGTVTWTTLRDPDGNKFCVAQRPPGD